MYIMELLCRHYGNYLFHFRAKLCLMRQFQENPDCNSSIVNEIGKRNPYLYRFQRYSSSMNRIRHKKASTKCLCLIRQREMHPTLIQKIKCFGFTVFTSIKFNIRNFTFAKTFYFCSHSFVRCLVLFSTFVKLNLEIF